MKLKRRSLWTAAASAAAVLFLLLTSVAAAEPSPVREPDIRAKSALLMDAQSGRVLYEKNADEKSLIASTTKIMTGLLVCEGCDLEAEYVIPPKAAGIEGSSMYLKAGEVYTIRQLLYGLMLQSGNDAAAALALAHSGTEAEFVERMNRRAAQLGLANTHFENPSGLDAEGHYSTARDLAALSRVAMENDTFREVVSAKSFPLEGRVLTNHNKLLWRYEGALGVKTGYTRAAGRVLVSCAQRERRRLIAVTIHDPQDWEDHTRLLDYGFAAYENRCVLSAGQVIDRVPVVGGAAQTAEALVWDAVCLPLKPEEQAQLRIHTPRFVYAPVLVGPAGYLELWCGEEMLSTVPVYYREPVERKERTSRWKGLLGD